MLLKRPIRPSRLPVARLPRTCGRRFLRSSPATFAGKPPRDWMKQFAEENKRRFKESRWSKEDREEVIFATRRPLEPLNHESRLDTPKQIAEGGNKLSLHEMTLNELVEVSALVQKRIERLSQPSSGESTREEAKRFTEEYFEGRDEESRGSQEMRKEKMERDPDRRRTWTIPNEDSNVQEEDNVKAAEKTAEPRGTQKMLAEMTDWSPKRPRSRSVYNEDFNQQGEDLFKAAEKRVEEMLARVKLPSPATRPLFESECAPRQGPGHDELASRLSGSRIHSQREVPNETPLSSTRHQNATSPESVTPQALKTHDQHSHPLGSSPATFESGSTEGKLSSPETSAQERPSSMNGGQHLPEGTYLRFERPILDRERTEKATEWLKDMLRKAGKLDEAPPRSQHWSIPQNFEPPQKIEPLVFSRAEEAWVKSEIAMSLDSNQHKLKFGDVLPVVQWNLRMFGPSQYIPARSTAAMDLLGEIFGWKPTSMAVTLHEVNPQTLQSIMSHPWVRRNFLVGFDDKSYIFNDRFPAEVGLDDLPSVLLVTADLRTDNWISRRLGQSHRVLSVDLPIQGQHEQQDRRDLLRLCAARLERVVLGNRWTAYDQDRENERKTKMENDINDFMTTGHSPEDNVVSTVMARDLTFRHLDGSRSRQYRHKYRWWNNGAMKTREARVVDFWSTANSNTG
ncbi:hypothetical protein IWX90DRAFT_299342 [Phyllosticta citrichinensis]|uniref:Uncharacterized protein n=1 Tax=Phyllosticta citrichinensis TaxID=1130410 RepID=A0ABR1XKN9_9PEZI